MLNGEAISWTRFDAGLLDADHSGFLLAGCGRGSRGEEGSQSPFINAGVKLLLTSIIKNPVYKVRMCVPGGIGGQGRGNMYMSMKHTATTLKSPGAVRIYLPKFQCGPKHSEASEPTHPPNRHARISLSHRPVEEIGPRPYFS